MIALDNLQFIRTGDHHIVLCVGKSQMERGGVSLKNCSQYLEGKVYFSDDYFEDDTDYSYDINLKKGCYQFLFSDEKFILALK